MDVIKKLAELHAEPMASADGVAVRTVDDVERALGFALPDTLKTALSKVSGAIAFDATVLFKPMESSGWEDKDGSLDLNVIYGLAEDDWSLTKMNDTYAGRIPANCIAIGESSGGNQICLEADTNKVVFWDHEAATDGVFLISNSFDEFLESLYLGDDSLGDSSGIIESESYLDF